MQCKNWVYALSILGIITTTTAFAQDKSLDGRIEGAAPPVRGGDVAPDKRAANIDGGVDRSPASRTFMNGNNSGSDCDQCGSTCDCSICSGNCMACISAGDCGWDSKKR